MTRCYVLGNGPTLPVDDLRMLEDEPTIGVNRIGLVFTPTVLYWSDCSRLWDPGHEHVGLDCLRVTSCKKDHLAGLAHHYLRLAPPHLPKERWSQDKAYIAGSSAGAMVRWAWALGFREIVCLGMGGDGHFYGDEPLRDEHLRRFEEDRALLKKQLGGAVTFADSLEGVV